MTIEEHVYSLLSAAAGVIALAPAARIKVPGDWQGLARPYIVHFPVAVDPTYTHSGRASQRRWASYQVSAFADSYSGARALADAVVAALDGTHATGGGDGTQFFWRGRTASFEEDTRVHQIIDEFEVFEAL